MRRTPSPVPAVEMMKPTTLFPLLLALLTAVPVHPQAPEPAGAWLDVPGGRLYYETAGSGAPVVLLHGGFGDRRMWDDQLPALLPRYRVIRYDHRGFGRSPQPDTAYLATDDLRRLLDHLGVAKAHLMGNSVGGMVALEFALAHPERVASLVMVASGAAGFPVPAEERTATAAFFGGVRTRPLAETVRMWAAHPMLAATRERPAVRRRVGEMIADNAGIFTMAAWPFGPTGGTPPARRLGEVRVPTLLVWGDRDIAGVRLMADSTAHGIRGARREVMPGLSHLPQMEEPARFNRVLLAFLRSLP